MPPIKPGKPKVKTDREKKSREKNLKRTLLDKIGVPDDLFKVDAKQLWNTNRYRINIYRIMKDGKLSITDSYFAQLLPGGIVFSPEPKFKYYDGELEKLFAKQPNSLVRVAKE